MNKRMNKGFTLVEIMIVVAIIAILAAVAIPNFIRYRNTSQMNACIANMKQIQSAAEQYLLTGKTTVQLSDLAGDKDKYIKSTPYCPADKTKSYTVGVADGVVSVTCAYGGTGEYLHVLPDADAASAGE